MRRFSQWLGRVLKEWGRSIVNLPALAWFSLVVGLVGLLLTNVLFGPATSSANSSAHWGLLTFLQKLPWRDLIFEISLAAVVSFFLALFLEAPLRENAITKLGRDFAPFLISALTVPEMRYKMRQICEYAVIRKQSKMLLWVTEEPGTPTRYRLKVQMRSRYCNISNAAHSITTRVAVDEETDGKIIKLAVRPVNVVGVAEYCWSCNGAAQPDPVDGRRVVEHNIRFPRTDDWEHSYVEVTGEYDEDVNLIGNVAKTLFESYWPLMDIEIECAGRPHDVAIKINIPYHDDVKRIDHADRWLSTVALLPGERVDIILTKGRGTPPPLQTANVPSVAAQGQQAPQQQKTTPAAEAKTRLHSAAVDHDITPEKPATKEGTTVLAKTPTESHSAAVEHDNTPQKPPAKV